MTYSFTWFAILREPLFLFGGFLFAFFVFIGISRVSVELSVPGDEVKDIVIIKPKESAGKYRYRTTACFYEGVGWWSGRGCFSGDQSTGDT